MSKRQKYAQAVHARRLKAIRPFVNFDYDLRKPLSAAAKRKVKRYFDFVDSLQARNHIVYRSRAGRLRLDRLRAAQEFAQHDEFLPGIKVAFIPVADANNAKLHVGKGKTPVFKVRERGITRIGIPFNARSLVRDPAQHVNALVAAHPEVTHFAIQAGKYEISAAIAPKQVAPRVIQLMERYSPGGLKFHKTRRSSNHWREWMFGLNAYEFPNQASTLEYMQAKVTAAKKLKKARRKQRRDNSRKK